MSLSLYCQASCRNIRSLGDIKSLISNYKNTLMVGFCWLRNMSPEKITLILILYLFRIQCTSTHHPQDFSHNACDVNKYMHKYMLEFRERTNCLWSGLSCTDLHSLMLKASLSFCPHSPPQKKPLHCMHIKNLIIRVFFSAFWF